MKRLLGIPRHWKRNAVIAAAAGIFLGLLGPFGNYLTDSIVVRVAYWVAALWAGTCIFEILLRPALKNGERLHWPPAITLFVATIIAAIPLATVCRILALKLWPGPIGKVGIFTWYMETLIISAPMVVAHGIENGVSFRPRWVRDRHQSKHDTREMQLPAELPEAPQSFIARLPPHLGHDLVALQMEDHYVRAYTRCGSTLILIPLHQAIQELNSLPGLKVHRSWWVARSAVIGWLRDGRNLRLRLINDLEAPVARANVAEVRAAGLLERRA